MFEYLKSGHARLNKTFLILIVTFGLIALVGSATRLFMDKLQPLIIGHVLAYVLILALTIFRKKISITARFTFMFSLGLALSFAGMYSMRLASTGFVMFGTISIMISLLFGIRAGIALFIASTLFTIGIGLAEIYRIFPAEVDYNVYLRSPYAWISQISMYIFISSLAFACLATFITGLRSSVSGLRENNAKLDSEIMEKNRLAAELAEREQKYRLLAENTSDVIFIQNMGLEISYISPSVERLFGYSQEEASRLTMDRYMTTDSLRKAVGSFQEYAICAQTEKTDVPLMEFQYIRKDGSLFWGELKVRFLYNDEGKLAGAQGVLRDITARKTAMDEKLELERSLRHSERLQSIGQLAGGIAHDFNNQLTSMCANADLIIMHCGDNEDARGFATEIKKAIDRSSSLISRLLKISRKSETKPVELDVHAVLDDIAIIMSRSTDNGIVIEKQYDAESPFVFADRAQFFNAILNLCINARDAMPSGGTIRLSTENTVFDRSAIRGYCATSQSDLKGSVVRISVSDTGEGIEEEILSRIFEPFYTTKQTGIGMGLASVVGMVKSHRGSLSVYSARFEGSHFSIYLASVPPADIELSRRR